MFVNISVITPSSGNVAIPVGISLGVASLIVIIGLGGYCYRKRRNNEGNLSPEEDIEMEAITSRPAEENQESLSTTDLVVPGATFDLNKA